MAMTKKQPQGMQVKLVAALCMAAVAVPVYASTPDPLVEGARLCTQRFPLEEKKNNIPTHLLAAIATTESGRWHKELGMKVPWPWTINVEGKGYFFGSKAEAIAQTRNFMAQGKQSIDVGCMQVNLKHHPKAFADLNQAFDPVTNVAYSAKFLRDNYATMGDWIKATAAYHSRTPVHGQRYLGEIERSWNQIVAKVATARAGKGNNAVETKLAMAPAKRDAEPMPTVISSKPASAAPAMQEARRSRVIQVNDAQQRRASEVMVVRATPSAPKTEPAVKVADATPVIAPTQSVVTNAAFTPSSSVRRVSLDNPASGAIAKSSSQFVFAN